MNQVYDKDRMQQQLEKLLKLPKIEQKTKEWYDARNNLITASDFAQALGQGKFGSQKQLIEKKVCVDAEYKPLKNIFFEWGNLFEPVACDVYSAMKNTIVHDFGLLRHPRHLFFGASPDGITKDGVMLEIKCPFKRKITGEIPLQYYYQIQGQLDVCELRECDYFECEFAKFLDYEEYQEAYKNGQYTGIINELDDKTYEYSVVNTSLCDRSTKRKSMYWVLNKHFLETVNKDDEFTESKLQELKIVWEKILFYRENPEQFKIEVKKTLSLQTSTFKSGKCMMIDLVESSLSSGMQIVDLEKKMNKVDNKVDNTSKYQFVALE